MANPDVFYKVIAVDRDRGQIAVRFFNADIPEGLTTAIDMPVQDGQVLVLRGDALRDYIMGFCPMGEFARAQAKRVQGAIDMTELEAQLDVPVPPATPSTVPGVSVTVRPMQAMEYELNVVEF